MWRLTAQIGVCACGKIPAISPWCEARRHHRRYAREEILQCTPLEQSPVFFGHYL